MRKGKGPPWPGGGRWTLQRLCACRTFCPTIQYSWILWRVSVHLLWSEAHVWEGTCASFAHRQQTQAEAPLNPRRGWPVLARWPFRQCMTSAWIVDQPTWRWEKQICFIHEFLMAKGRALARLWLTLFFPSQCVVLLHLARDLLRHEVVQHWWKTPHIESYL